MSDLKEHDNILVSIITSFDLSESKKSYNCIISFTLRYVPHDFSLSSVEHSSKVSYLLIDGLKARLLYFTTYGKEGNREEILEFLKQTLQGEMNKKIIENSGE